MNDSVLEKFITRRAEPAAAPAVQPDPTEDLGAYGWLRGVQDRAIMLELRQKDGSVSALAYHLLDRADFNPSDGITLQFGGAKVKITGLNLNAETPQGARLYGGIIRHRVPWIQEMDEPTSMEAPKGATVVERIEIK